MSTIVYDGSCDPLYVNSMTIHKTNNCYTVIRYGLPMYSNVSFWDILIFPKFILLFCPEDIIVIAKERQAVCVAYGIDNNKQCFIEYDTNLYIFGRKVLYTVFLDYERKTESRMRPKIPVSHDNIISMLVGYIHDYDPRKIRNKDYIGSVEAGIQKNMEPLKIVPKLYDLVIYCN